MWKRVNALNDYDVFVGRQPIFDRNENIYAYELLYRVDDSNFFPKGVNPEDATLQLIIHTFLTIGKDKVIGQKKSFINFTETLLFDEVMNQLNPNYVVIEVLEDVEMTTEVIEQIKKIHNKGFTIALDDFVMHDGTVAYDALFKLVHIVKIDYLFTPPNERKRMERILKQYPHLSSLAEKIETEAQYEQAKKDGYHLFQGYFFAEPEIVKGTDIPMNQVLHFHVFQMLNRENVDVQEITQLIQHDLSLTYKLLRYINSVTFDIPNEIKSIKQAIMLMGLKETKKWFRVLLFRDLGQEDGRTNALIQASLVRAKTCELLAEHKQKSNPDMYFLVGMFSMIDIIMNQNWDSILPRLHFTDIINDTLIGKETPMTPYLKLSIAVERLDMEEIEYYASLLQVEQKKLRKMTREAHKWTTKFM